ncbi:hypothetical protein BU24DRAFT_428482 [Aaosphaeria arxii CBS 175.79]|uniref:Uncharacterized protein n=1 Tax=Aaosphaeria arxii CBS 175.79 TaxID=1450172 RepID=A0A6A5X9E1_9PLEO|nr:uncharacterized protein BU24DRAFT_428482 [Aaosphaeria arxii CBS 175.79]KAF2009588.1 hypothetical protein BU24DRAFT_428482 [Aaosphaeria arxii CBS 175.79]
METAEERKLPHLPNRKSGAKPTKQSSSSSRWYTGTGAFAAALVLITAVFRPTRWLIAGAPVLSYSLVLGEYHGHRVVPFLPLWTIISTLNLAYVIASTSWLLYWVFAGLCYPAIVLTCLFQFDAAARFARKTLRGTLLRDLHFIKDKVAFFDLPALEIDGDVQGLFSIRGVTLSLSTLTLVAHGVEVGIKLSEDMELAIQTDEVTVSLLREIVVDDVYANVKGGDWEMTFGSLKPDSIQSDDDSFMVKDTAILRAASAPLDGKRAAHVGLAEAMTGGDPPEEAPDAGSAFQSVKKLSPDENEASHQYNEIIKHIQDTSEIKLAIDDLKRNSKKNENDNGLDMENEDDLRAAICAHIHSRPSIPHPPQRSIRLSTLKKTNYPGVKKFLHRLPLLYRLLLNPICYFHPVSFKSITAAGSGKWFVSLMDQYLFKHYSTQDPDVRRLKARISAWLADANFAVGLKSMRGTAQFPINTNYDIETHYKIGDIMAHRVLPGSVDLKQVVSLAGADATLSIPTYMFPHHEHIMPSQPTEFEELEMEQAAKDAEGTPREVQAQTALDQLRKDEANLQISAHVHLPARFHQDLLNFIAALVKATKVIETDKDFEEAKTLRELKRVTTDLAGKRLSGELSDSEASSIASAATGSGMSGSTIGPVAEDKGFRNFLRKVDTGFKEAGVKTRDGMRKAGVSTVSAMANDRWIAKLVGKVTRKLEKAQGDIGYSGKIPVSLQKQREKSEDESKLLP